MVQACCCSNPQCLIHGCALARRDANHSWRYPYAPYPPIKDYGWHIRYPGMPEFEKPRPDTVPAMRPEDV